MREGFLFAVALGGLLEAWVGAARTKCPALKRKFTRVDFCGALKRSSPLFFAGLIHQPRPDEFGGSLLGRERGAIVR